MGSDCPCPVCDNGPVPTLPLGVSFSDRVRVEPIPKRVVEPIYESHHSYMASTPSVNIDHHGIYFDGYLCGAITWRQPLMRRLGDVDGGDIVEVARVCIAVDMPNLASAALSKSQDKFVREYARPNGIKLLVTFVHGEMEGSMVRALKDKGWERTPGVRQGKQAGNRTEKEIRDVDKVRWLCQLEQPTEQTTLARAVQ